MMLKLAQIEICVYFCVWIGGVFYSMYRFQLLSDKYSSYLTDDLIDGWKWLHRKQDIGDYEWNTWSHLFLRWLPCVFFYLIINQCLKYRFRKWSSVIGIFISSLWMFNTIGISRGLLILSQPVILSWLYQISSVKYLWILCVTFTLALHSSWLSPVKVLLFQNDTTQEYIFSVLLAWTQARTISFVVDNVVISNSLEMFGNLMHYCFYLPLLPSGPIMLYKDFKKSVGNDCKVLDFHLLLKNLLNIGRYLFWWFFHTLCLHYFYHSSFQYYTGLVATLDVWALSGLGYSLGQFFMTKYTVLYGLPSSLARTDGVDAPPGPKCVGRIHLYSQMWRDFDVGLYRFMLNYIYVPVRGSDRTIFGRLKGSLASFLFVCVWHGSSSSVIVWVVFNYIGICIETVSTYWSVRQPFVEWKTKWSESSWDRFSALLSSPLLLLSAISNFYFFTDVQVGNIFIKTIYEGGVTRLLKVLFFMYCCCHVSITVNKWELKRKPKQDFKEEILKGNKEV